MADRRVLQDWIGVTCMDDASIVQSRERALVVGPDDEYIRIEVVHLGGTGDAVNPILELVSAPSDEGPLAALPGSGTDSTGSFAIELKGAHAGLVLWRLRGQSNPALPDERVTATFRITVHSRDGGVARPVSLRDPRSSCLQPWVSLTIPVPTGSNPVGEITQSEEFWYDAGDLPSLGIVAAVAKYTGGATLWIETTDDIEGTWTLVDTCRAGDGIGRAQTFFLSREGDVRASRRFKRYIRWHAKGGSSEDVEICFRMSITPAAGYAPLPGTGASGRGAGCGGCACGGADRAVGMLGGPFFDELRPVSPAGIGAARDFLAGRRVPVNPLPYAPPAVDKNALCAELRTRFEEGRVLLPSGDVAQTPASQEAEAMARALGCPWPEFIPHRPFYQGSTELSGPPYKGPGPQPCRSCQPRFRRA